VRAPPPIPASSGLHDDEGLELERFVEELGPAAEVAHVSNAAGILGEGLLYDDPAGELDLDPVVARIGQLVPYVVAEINEPDHRFSPNIKDGYRHVEQALARKPRPGAGRRGGCRPRTSTGRPSSAAAIRSRTCSRSATAWPAHACWSPAAPARSAAR
jgi:hypothetical protein